LERLSLLRHAKRFAENKEIDSCTKVRIGMHGSYPIREEKCFKVTSHDEHAFPSIEHGATNFRCNFTKFLVKKANKMLISKIFI
jgi:hypothetical protein